MSIYGQIRGNVLDVNGKGLPHASVYFNSTTSGTVTNELGSYELTPTAIGKYKLVFQYVGYEKKIIDINYLGKPMNLDVVLEEDINLVGELIITADREDPAYNIIRQAIKKRPFYKNQFKSFESDLYVKGTVKVLDAPDKILGNEVGDMGGMLDSIKQGILYLSESQSKFYFQQPDQTKEIMISSIMSGDNNLFTINQFSLANFDLYDNYLKFGRSIVSPIGDNALSHYNYVLEKMFIDKNDLMIYKIYVKPKLKNAPLLTGHIYIVDELWNIHSADFAIRGNTIKSTFIDTIHLQQIFLPVEKNKWRLFNQNVVFEASVIGFKMGGNFSYIFSNYLLNQDLTHIFNSKETFRVEKDALKTDTSFWNKFRPVPLTIEEEKDYIKKDSLAKIWNSRVYLDSMDRVGNKFKANNILMGYSYRNSFKDYSINYPSPLSTIRYNVVEGFNLNLDVNYTKTDSLMRYWIINPAFRYGYTDKIIKPFLKITRRFNNEMLGTWSLSIGRILAQFDYNNPIELRNNSWNSLLHKKNRIRLYNKEMIGFEYRRELINSFYVELYSEYAKRSLVQKNIDYSFFYRHRIFAENIPNQEFIGDYLAENRIWLCRIKMRWRPGQTYSSYPNIRTRRSSNWPEIYFEHAIGVPLDNNGSSNPFYSLVTRIKDNYVDAKLYGYFQYNVEFSKFLSGVPTFFGDFLHPTGNEFLMPINPDFAIFNLLPFYSYSTDNYFGAMHFKHHFNGYIIDKIPILNKTSLKTIAGTNILYHPTKGWYTEFSIGLENFRAGPVPLGSLEYVWSFGENGFRDSGFVFKLTQVVNN